MNAPFHDPPIEADDHELAELTRNRSGVRIRRGLLWLCAAFALAATALGVVRVARIEQSELERNFPAASLREAMRRPGSSRISARLAQLELRAGQQAIFEVCASDAFPEARWRSALEFLVLQLEHKQLMLRVALDAPHLAHVRRNSGGGCLPLGAGPIRRTGNYSIEAVWPAQPPPEPVLDVALTPRILAKQPLTHSDRWCVLVLGSAVLALLLINLFARRDRSIAASTARPLPRLGAAACALLILFAASEVAVSGPTWTLLKGVVLMILQAALAWGLARRFARGAETYALGLHAPKHLVLALVAAACAWPLLVGAARLALRWVPSTGEAPIQTFISWPSGMLAAALLGVLLPAAEELFFRGYLYGALLPLGRVAAAVGSVLLFGLLHLPQSWGNWGGLLAIFAAGAVLCALRVATGSVLIAALAHVAYNLTLALTSIASSID